MTRFTHSALFALVGFSMISAGNVSEACPRSGGGGGYYRSSYSSTSHYTPSHYTPSIQHHSYPTYAEPPRYQESVIHNAPTPRHYVPQPSPEPISQPVRQTYSNHQVQVTGGTTQTFTNQQVQATGRPLQAAPVRQAAPVVQTNTIPRTAPAPRPIGTSNSQATALQMLANFSDPAPAVQETVPAPVAPAFNGIGTWRATLPNGSTVNLTLQPNGSFTWVANSQGKASTFQGNYTMTNDSLTLSRSDSQKLNGQLNPQGNSQFIFTIDGAKDNGLTFERS